MLPTHTTRLRFREMTEADLSAIATLDISASRDPQGWIAWNRQNYVEHGFGLWVIETLDGEFIGDCGLTMHEVESEWLVEVGWHVRADMRCQGYASEAAQSVRDTARASGAERLIAIIRPDNAPSQAVAIKIGLALERQIVKHRGPALIFGADLHPVVETL